MRRHGVRSAFFTGAESQRRRDENVVAFHDDPATRILFATDAGGVGLNLQRAASCCLHFDLPWNPAVFEQRVGRVWRLGQTEKVDVYSLIGERCIETRMAGALHTKQAAFSAVFDGDSDEVRFEEQGGFLRAAKKLVDDDDVAVLGDVDDRDADQGPRQTTEPDPAIVDRSTAQASHAGGRNDEGSDPPRTRKQPTRHRARRGPKPARRPQSAAAIRRRPGHRSGPGVGRRAGRVPARARWRHRGRVDAVAGRWCMSPEACPRGRRCGRSACQTPDREFIPNTRRGMAWATGRTTTDRCASAAA